LKSECQVNFVRGACFRFVEDKTIIELISKLDVSVKDGRKYRLVAENDLPEGFDANKMDEETDDQKDEDGDSVSDRVSDKMSDRVSDISVASSDLRQRSQTSSPGSTGHQGMLALIPNITEISLMNDITFFFC